MIDTDTRLSRPAELIDDALTGLDRTAVMHVEQHTLVMEDARPLDRPEYRGRHRTDGPARGEPWNRDPAWFPSEETADLSAQVAVPLPSREPGEALARAQSVTRTARLQSALMRTAHKLRSACGGEGGSR